MAHSGPLQAEGITKKEIEGVSTTLRLTIGQVDRAEEGVRPHIDTTGIEHVPQRDGTTAIPDIATLQGRTHIEGRLDGAKVIVQQAIAVDEAPNSL